MPMRNLYYCLIFTETGKDFQQPAKVAHWEMEWSNANMDDLNSEPTIYNIEITYICMQDFQ